MPKPILAIDFDGTIHSYRSKWTRADEIHDAPTPGALEWMERAQRWFDVQVFSSRALAPNGLTAIRDWMAEQAFLVWDSNPNRARVFLSHLTYPTVKPSAFLMIDDRALLFEGDWSTLDPQALLNFRPWNRRN